MSFKSLYKRIKTNDGFTDFKHHASSWRNSKKLRQKNRRMKMKLTYEELEKLYVEMEENEAMREYGLLQLLENEDAGDRI